jgi:hypothetical protein
MLQDRVELFSGETVRPFLFVFALLLVAAPLQAQKIRRDRYRVSAEELVEYADQNMADVLARARPHFFTFNSSGNSQGAGEATMQGTNITDLRVYVGNQAQGDSTMLRYYKASDVKEVRFYKPNEAMARLGGNGGSYVIQLIMKDAVSP